MSTWRLGNGVVELGVSAAGGYLWPIRFRHGERIIEPMHRAPWTEAAGASDIPMLQGLRGDFFCAPFGDSDLLEGESRPHGLTANGRWRELERSPTRLLLELEGTVAGAAVRKEIYLLGAQPVIYQRHEFHGGSGRIPLGHHAMLRAPAAEPLRLAFSPWVWAGTPPAPVEGDPARGRSRLRYPQRLERLEAAALQEGGTVDLTSYPELEDSEEIVMLVTDPEQAVGWSTATAPGHGWAWFGLRPNGVLRNTVLWLSNGGRDYPPFSGRHRRVIGVEEVTGYFHLGHRASATDNELSRLGHPTAVELAPGRVVATHYAFGAVPVPRGFERVHDLEVHPHELLLRGPADRGVRVPLDGGFLAPTSP